MKLQVFAIMALMLIAVSILPNVSATSINVTIRSEDTGSLYSMDNTHTYNLHLYYTDNTEDTFPTSSNYFSVSGASAVTKAVLEDSGSIYVSRVLAPASDPTSLTFYIPNAGDDNIIRTYTFMLKDYWTGNYGYPGGRMEIKENGNVIDSDYWNTNYNIFAQLLLDHVYTLVLKPTSGPDYVVTFRATYTYDYTITLRPPDMENVTYLRDHWSWAAWRDTDNVINVFYNDGWDNTISAHVTIYRVGSSTVLYDNTDTTDNVFLMQWDSGDNTHNYRVALTAVHGTFGTIRENKIIMGFIENHGMPSDYYPDHGSLFGLPSGLTIASLASLVGLVVVALSFGALFPVQCVLALGFSALLLKLFGWLAFSNDTLIIGFIITFGIMIQLGKMK